MRLLPLRLRRCGLLGLLLLLLLLIATAAPAPAPAPLQPRIDAILRDVAGDHAFWGIYVRALGSGEVLYRHNARHRFMPASNQKLLTSATALDVLGGAHRYETKLFFDGRVRDAVLTGDLVLHGSGDPTFGSSEMLPRSDPLDRWAERLAEAGVTAIRGRLIGDDDAFDERPYAEGWDVDYVINQSSRYLGVSIGGITYRDNLIKLRIASGRPGTAPEITTDPPEALTVYNRATTRARRSGRAIDVRRLLGDDAVIVTGSMPRSYRATINVPATNPTLLALRALRDELREAGINVSDLEVIDIDELEDDEAPDLGEARLLFLHLSPPLAGILAVVNKESNNFYADQLFRSFGWGGTANGAENRVKALLERAGADPGAVSLRDGSGLSRKNMVTPRAMGLVLAYMSRQPEYEAFRAALPAGGEPESTLRYRLSGVPVRAKTGSLEFVRALSGYATTAGGHEVAFVIFANHYDAPSYRITQTIDRIARTIAATPVG